MLITQFLNHGRISYTRSAEFVTSLKCHYVYRVVTIKYPTQNFIKKNNSTKFPKVPDESLYFTDEWVTITGPSKHLCHKPKCYCGLVHRPHKVPLTSWTILHNFYSTRKFNNVASIRNETTWRAVGGKEPSWNLMAHGWRTGWEVKGKLANGVGNQYSSHYLGTWCIQHYYRWCAHLGCQ